MSLRKIKDFSNLANAKKEELPYDWDKMDSAERGRYFQGWNEALQEAEKRIEVWINNRNCFISSQKARQEFYNIFERLRRDIK